MIIIGIRGTRLQPYEISQLENPNCSGVILFSRNYENTQQLKILCQEIRNIRANLLICVDHEGGRVQRFREGFTLLPPMLEFGNLFKESPLSALELTQAAGFILAYELRQLDIDFSFTPVLDLYDEVSTVIGNRAFSNNPSEVSALASALRQGMRKAGMAAVGKHFPGHGRVFGDSHHLLPKDERPFANREKDLYPFYTQIQDGIEAIMTAHIMLPLEDNVPAGFSTHFMNKLRNVGFSGVIISDDLDMSGAMISSNPIERVQAALSAGADITLMCNHFSGIDEALTGKYQRKDENLSKNRLKLLRGKPFSPQELEKDYLAAKRVLKKYTTGLVA